MGLRINTNVASLNAQRNLMGSKWGLDKSLERLSSGYRINRAGDDAAGLAISENLRGQIRGLKQASRNAQDGVSLVQVCARGEADISENGSRRSAAHAHLVPTPHRLHQRCTRCTSCTSCTEDRSAR